MDGISGVLARVDELQQRLSTLRPPVAPGRFQALLGQAGGPAAGISPPVPPTSTAGTASASAAWSAALRPSVLKGSGSPAPAAALDPASFPNGRIPEAALTPIGGGERLAGPAAAAFLSLRAAAAAEGVQFGVNDSYRSYEEQVDVARRKGLYSEGGLAARPGTSDHGHGNAVDLQLDGRALTWMRENAGRFGFAEDVPREPWHWTFTPPG